MRGGGVRRRTVRTGLRFIIAAGVLLLLGTFYSQQVNAFFSLPGEGAIEFVKLSFFWSGIFGAIGVFTVVIGLMQRASATDRFSLLPAILLVVFLFTLYFTLFYRALFTPLAPQPLRPGETLII